MLSFRFLAFVGSLYFSTSSFAVVLSCPDKGKIFNSDTKAVTWAADAAPHTLLAITAGVTQGKLEVSGHPLKPSIQLVTDQNEKVKCQVTGDPGELFEALITNKAMRAGIDQWHAWKNKQPKVCDPFLDSIGYFVPGNSRTAIVMHGLGSNPRAMAPVISILLDDGYNVIAPRLAHHFVANLKDLDNARYQDWEKDSEDALQIAQHLKPSRNSQITLAGYSLGGYLATRLAYKYPSEIDRMVLISPVWYMDALASLGSLIGGGQSLNSYFNLPIACKVNEGYVPAVAGEQIQKMLIDVPNDEFHGSPITDTMVPTLLVTSTTDEAIDPLDAIALCKQHDASCQYATITGVKHEDIVDKLSKVADGDKRSLAQIISAYLRGAWGGLSDEPMASL